MPTTKPSSPNYLPTPRSSPTAAGLAASTTLSACYGVGDAQRAAWPARCPSDGWPVSAAPAAMLARAAARGQIARTDAHQLTLAGASVDAAVTGPPWSSPPTRGKAWTGRELGNPVLVTEARSGSP
jgi:hypothetical protein